MGKCAICHDEGVVFVKTPRTDIKSLAMCCSCDCKLSKNNFWSLPIYHIDYTIITNPYLALRPKIGWQKSADYFAQHMKKSKLIWDGEL